MYEEKTKKMMTEIHEEYLIHDRPTHFHTLFISFLHRCGTCKTLRLSVFNKELLTYFLLAHIIL